MSEDILLRIIAQDQYSQEMKEAKAAVEGMTEAEKKSALAAKEHGAQLQKLGTIAKGAAIAGFGALTAAVGDSIKETMEYNKSIRELSQNLAIGTEETSRIVQTADDFTVSQDAVTTALQMAVKKGMRPSIDTLAQMADEYNSISDPTERAARLTEVFGRNWTALTPMLKEGGKAIRDAAAAQDEALLVTEKNSQATRDLEKNLDNLGDKVTALKLKVGNALVPVLNDAATGLGYLTDGMGTADEVENKYTRDIAATALVFGTESEYVKNLSKDFQEYLAIRQKVAMTDNEKRIRSEMAAIKELGVSYGGSVQGMKAYAQAAREANTYDKDYLLATDALIISTKELNKETLFKIATEGLSADAALAVAKSMGLVDEKTAANIQKQRDLKKAYDDGYISLGEYIKRTQELGTAIGLLPDFKAITIEVRTQTAGQGGKVSGEVDYNAPVPAAHPTGTTPSTVVHPSNNTTPYVGGHEAERTVINSPVDMKVYAAPGMDVGALADAVSQRLGRQTRAARNIGASRKL